MTILAEESLLMSMRQPSGPSPPEGTTLQSIARLTFFGSIGGISSVELARRHELRRDVREYAGETGDPDEASTR